MGRNLASVALNGSKLDSEGFAEQKMAPKRLKMAKKTAQNGKNGAETTNLTNGAHEAVSIRGWFSAAVCSAAFRLGSKSHAEAWTTYEKARGLVRGPGAVSAGKKWPKNGQNGPKTAQNGKNGAETTNFTNFANGANPCPSACIRG